MKLGFGLFVAGFVLNAIGAIAQGVWSRRRAANLHHLNENCR